MKTARDPAALRDALAARDLSLEETGLLARCAKGTVSAVLAGKPVNEALARRLAVILRRPIGELFVPVTSSNTQDNGEPSAVA